MLFVLTGEVQTGKTRWLERLVTTLASEGVDVAGVVAPGVWRESDDAENGFEKLGIDNVLLPQQDRLSFARRRDLALAEGAFDPTSQSAAARLAWEISEDAIRRVNRHFDDLIRSRHVFVGEYASQAGLVVIDELGRLELVHGGGLTSAVALLRNGSSNRFGHALVVAREWLAPNVIAEFGSLWGGATVLAPDEQACACVRSACGLPA